MNPDLRCLSERGPAGASGRGTQDPGPGVGRGVRRSFEGLVGAPLWRDRAGADARVGIRDAGSGTGGSVSRGPQGALRAVLVSLALVCLAAAAPLAAIEPLEFKDRAEEQRYQKLLRELRCLQCQNQSLADSDANVAGGLRQEIHRQMQAGKSNEEIKAFLVDRYGEFVLLRPRLHAGTLVLWLSVPGLLTIAAWLIWRARRSAVAGRAAAPPLSAEEERRLRELLSREEN